jgi:hypothetical protein
MVFQFFSSFFKISLIVLQTTQSETSLVATMVRHVERKALHIHNLYIVLIKGTTNLSTANTVVTIHGGIGRLPV